MKRSLQWPVLIVVLAGGIGLGRWAGPPIAQGQFTPPATEIPKELTSYRDIVKQVLPAVVSIEPKRKVTKPAATARRTIPNLPDNVPEEFRRFFEGQFQGQEMPQNPNLGFGSGFVVDPWGVILTNYHVVEGADSVDVTFNDGRKVSSTDFKSDQYSDIAVIRIKTDGPLTALKFGDSSQMEVGDRVLAVGAPFGLAGSVTHGIISAKGRDIGINRRQADD